MNIQSNVRELTISKPAESFLIFRGKREPWVEEKIMDRHEVIQEVSNDQDILRKVIAFSLEAGTCRDATSEIVGTVVHRWAEDNKLLTEKEYEFVEMFMGFSVARAFRMEDA